MLAIPTGVCTLLVHGAQPSALVCALRNLSVHTRAVSSLLPSRPRPRACQLDMFETSSYLGRVQRALFFHLSPRCPLKLPLLFLVSTLPRAGGQPGGPRGIGGSNQCPVCLEDHQPNTVIRASTFSSSLRFRPSRSAGLERSFAPSRAMALLPPPAHSTIGTSFPSRGPPWDLQQVLAAAAASFCPQLFEVCGHRVCDSCFESMWADPEHKNKCCMCRVRVPNNKARTARCGPIVCRGRMYSLTSAPLRLDYPGLPSASRTCATSAGRAAAAGARVGA